MNLNIARPCDFPWKQLGWPRESRKGGGPAGGGSPPMGGGAALWFWETLHEYLIAPHRKMAGREVLRGSAFFILNFATVIWTTEMFPAFYWVTLQTRLFSSEENIKFYLLRKIFCAPWF